ncbi:MAG TPA: HD domain-containing protein, partial [Gemmatimonadaceae bacterium]|nr:HD domain-containing protein [Gemmatimonadaceae bacterium]
FLVRNDQAMTVTGYSDVINHALAFAAKHHDRQVRKGTKLPYLTHPANVAIILSRYGRDNDTVVAGILHDVIEDCVRDGYTSEMFEQRIGDKFGAKVLETVLAVTYRRHDDDGVELSGDERRADYLERLAGANDEARWVCAADKIHNASSIISDLRRTVDPDTIWARFGGGKAATARWYRQVYERLEELGFKAPIMGEFDKISAELVKLAG